MNRNLVFFLLCGFWSALFFTGLLPAADSGDSEAVEVTGYGATAEEAMKDAFSRAVGRVVGAIVESSVEVKNDDLIAQKILTLSSGFITSYKDLGLEKVDGLFSQKIYAIVKKREIKDRIQSFSSASNKIDGASLMAEAVSKQKSSSDAEEMIQSLIEKFSASCLVAKSFKPVMGDMNGSANVPFGVPVHVTIDPTAYREFDQKLRQILKKICLNSVSFSVRSRDLATLPEGPRRDRNGNIDWRFENADWFPDHLGIAVRGGIRVSSFLLFDVHRYFYGEQRERIADSTDFSFVLFDRFDQNTNDLFWTRFWMDKKYIKVFDNASRMIVEVCVDLHDRAGGLIDSATKCGVFGGSTDLSCLLGVGAPRGRSVGATLSLISPGLFDRHDSFFSNERARVYSLAPAFKYNLPSNYYSAFSSELRFLQHFVLQSTQLRDLVEIKCTVRNSGKLMEDSKLLYSEEGGLNHREHLQALLKIIRERH
jgi:hypothetical protein